MSVRGQSHSLSSKVKVNNVEGHMLCVLELAKGINNQNVKYAAKLTITSLRSVIL